MNKFSWYDAKTVEDALKQVNTTASEALQPGSSENTAIFKCGGTDLLDLMKEGLLTPQKIVNIRTISGLDRISYDRKTGLRIGANATLSQIASEPVVKENYLAFKQAVAHAATPQIRNMASLGGNLAQRTRCWYFRSIDHQCLRKGGNSCFARHGENEYHAIMENGLCVSVHASSVATALMAFDARIEITGAKGRKKEVPMDKFFVLPEDDVSRESILKADELITAVIIPPVTANTRSCYIYQGARESHDWPLADVAVVLELSGTSCKNATVVLGAAAPIPLKAEAASHALTGRLINEETAVAAGEASMQGAMALSKNAYKIPIFKAIVKRAVLGCL
ncbi:FAD binding domain-containing protein [Sulfurimonas sp. HSL3-7]|uniref:FAD binding domain-containing protein n=1 Tax=Sulfonitrofixus jiaomeiensis TaxID=3131938 RepID=UPI0031F8B971